MKKKTTTWNKAYLAALFVLLVSMVGMQKVFAFDFSAVCETGQTLYYNIIDADSNYVELTYPNLENNDYWFGYEKPTGNIIFSENVQYNGITYSLTSIGSCAFYGCSGLTGSLTIPKFVTKIGESAFSGCSGFTGCLTIPNSVTTIGVGAFSYCNGFTGSLTIPNSVTTIGGEAFSHCSGFTGSLTIPNSVTTIELYTFMDCSGFTGHLSIPDSVTIIKDLAFRNCSGINSISVPTSVQSLTGNAFNGTGWYNSQPNGVLYLEEWCLGYKGNASGSLVIREGTTYIASKAFEECCDFTGSLTIPNTVTTIGYRAFVNCTGFNGNLTIGNSVTYIGRDAFSGCYGFRGNLTIPNSVITIGNAAFCNCGFTGSLSIPNSVTAIENYAFSLCGFTGSLTIPNSVTEIGSGAFNGCNGFTGSLTIPNSVTTIGSQAFIYCRGFTGNLTIPNSVTLIGDWAFYGCSGFNGTLSIGNSVTYIGKSAFKNCSGFMGDLTIPNSVAAIRENAFYNCQGFDGDLFIGCSVETIGLAAFSDLIKINSITVWNETPPYLQDCFNNVNKNTPVYVPYNALTAYENADYWSEFTDFRGFSAEHSLTLTSNWPTRCRTKILQLPSCSTNETTIVARPDSGCTFVAWMENGVEVSRDSHYTFHLDRDMVLVAQVTSGTGMTDNEVVVFEVYPNPSSGFITIEGNGLLKVFNLFGQAILSKEIKEQESLELPQGVYLVSLNGTTRKVVVE